MYRLMIVDDEALSRYAFRTFTAKNFSQLEIIGEAENGREAIALAKNLMPDIIVMDIKMPGINGLDAAREILREQPNTKLIMLTAYENFDYVHQALDLGASSYLLKPLKHDEAVEKFTKVIESIDSGRNIQKGNKLAEDKLNKVLPFIERELVSTLLNGNFDIHEVKSYIHFLQLDINSGYVMLISLGIDNAGNMNDSIKSKVNRERVENFIAAHLPPMNKCLFGNCIGNTLVCFFPLEDRYQRDQVIKDAVMTAQEIQRKIKLNLHLDVVIGIGNPCTGLVTIKDSYDGAYMAVQRALNGGQVLHCSTMESEISPYHVAEQLLKTENKLLDTLRMGDFIKAREYMEYIMDYTFNSYSKITEIKEYLIALLSILKRNLHLMGFSGNEMDSIILVGNIHQITDYDELRIWTEMVLNRVVKSLESNQQPKENTLISQVFESVNRHFCKNITLETLADETKVTPQYLSRLFKMGCGMNFIDYITKKRVDYAKELLKTSDYSIKDIGNEVGYMDANYFCRLFKKSTGLTPKQYRNRSGR